MERITIDREIALHILKTLRASERTLVARDTVEALHRGAELVEYAPLTQDTIRARMWLEDQLVDVARIEDAPVAPKAAKV